MKNNWLTQFDRSTIILRRGVIICEPSSAKSHLLAIVNLNYNATFSKQFDLFWKKARCNPEYSLSLACLLHLVSETTRGILAVQMETR